jgi:hypothetical protein
MTLLSIGHYFISFMRFPLKGCVASGCGASPTNWDGDKHLEGLRRFRLWRSKGINLSAWNCSYGGFGHLDFTLRYVRHVLCNTSSNNSTLRYNHRSSAVVLPAFVTLFAIARRSVIRVCAGHSKHLPTPKASVGA